MGQISIERRTESRIQSVQRTIGRRSPQQGVGRVFRMTMVITLADISPDTWSRSITEVPQIVGRERTADIHLESRFVSKEHCRFWKEGADYFVEDAGSTNGTYIAGTRIGKHKLKSGDRIVIGNFEILVADDTQICPTDYELPSAETVFSQSIVDLQEPAVAIPSGPLSSLSAEERRLAAAVYQRLTPSRRIGLPGMLVEVAYMPSGSLGGDCFECLEMSDRYVLALFDSMNHGTKAALTIMLIRSELRRWVSLTHEPGKCLEQLNTELIRLKISDLYICSSLAMWFPATSTMVYATAGQHPPLWIRDQELLNPTEKAGGLPLGALEGETYEERLIHLRPKDRLFFFSDGLGDALRSGAAAGAATKRIAEQILRLNPEALHRLSQRIEAGHASGTFDDALLVGCEIGSVNTGS